MGVDFKNRPAFSKLEVVSWKMPSCFCFGLLGRWALCVRVGFVFTLCNAGGHAKYSLENFIMNSAHFFSIMRQRKNLCGACAGLRRLKRN